MDNGLSTMNRGLLAVWTDDCGLCGLCGPWKLRAVDSVDTGMCGLRTVDCVESGL